VSEWVSEWVSEGVPPCTRSPPDGWLAPASQSIDKSQSINRSIDRSISPASRGFPCLAVSLVLFLSFKWFFCSSASFKWANRQPLLATTTYIVARSRGCLLLGFRTDSRGAILWWKGHLISRRVFVCLFVWVIRLSIEAKVPQVFILLFPTGVLVRGISAAALLELVNPYHKPFHDCRFPNRSKKERERERESYCLVCFL